MSAPDDPVTFDQYADAEFEAVASDLKEARKTYQSRWTDMAIALSVMSKTHTGCRDLIERLEGQDKGDILDQWIEQLTDAKGWFEASAKIMDMALFRVCCGMSRLHKERGFTGWEDGDAD